jgi:hypothetical protein
MVKFEFKRINQKVTLHYRPLTPQRVVVQVISPDSNVQPGSNAGATTCSGQATTLMPAQAGSTGCLTVSHSRPCHISFLFLSFTTAPAVGCGIQSATTLASTISDFSFPVNTTILDLTILEFIFYNKIEKKIV